MLPARQTWQALEPKQEIGLKCFLVGSCMIPGFNVPPTKSLPILVSRGLGKKRNLKLKIQAYHKCCESEDLSLAIKEANLADNKFDIVVLQFLTYALLAFQNMMKRPDTWGGAGPKFYRVIKRLINTNWYRFIRKSIPEHWTTYIHYNILRLKPDPIYIDNLRNCIKLIQAQSKCTKIFLMTPIAPTSKRLHPLRFRFQSYRDSVFGLAREYGVGVIDIYTPLSEYGPEIVYQEDGFHPTRIGQEIIAESIVKALLQNLN